MAEALLIRHADAPWTPDESSDLSEAGRRAAERLAVSLDGFAIDAIYSSPYPRASSTVLPLARRRSLDVRHVADLRERRLGGGDFSDFRAAVRATWDDFSFAHPGGETSRAAQQRVVAAFERILGDHPDGRVAVSTHGNALALLLNFFDRSLGFEFWESLSRPDAFRFELGRDGQATVERLWGEADEDR